jgi:replicative DNA helicase
MADGIDFLDEEDMSSEEREALQKLVAGNPDAPTSGDSYSWNDEFQREIVSLLLQDESFCRQNINLVKHTYFTNEVHQKLCRILFSHFEEYTCLPTRIQLAQEVRDATEGKDPEVRVHFLKELNTVLQFYNPGIESRSYYSDKITEFAKEAELKITFHKCIQEFKGKRSWEKIKEMLREALLVDRDVDIGENYFEDAEERYERKKTEQEEGEIYTSGFKAIDDHIIGGGLGKGEMAAWMGLSGTGKSLALVRAAIANVNLGKKVLYITLENSEDLTADRFDAQIANPVGTESMPGINTLMEKDNPQIVINAIEDYVQDKEDKRLLIIKQFPGGQMSPSDLMAYHNQLKLQGFIPDLIVLDYIGEMKDYPGVKTYESRYKIVRDLRGWAVAEKICIISAMQANRSSKEMVKMGDVIDDEHLSDSFDQVKPLDALWTLNQFQDENDCEPIRLARVHVAKNRNGQAKYHFHIEINRHTLCMRQISKDLYMKVLKDYQSTKEEHGAQNVQNELSSDPTSNIIGNAKDHLKAIEGVSGKFSKEIEDDDVDVKEELPPLD